MDSFLDKWLCSRIITQRDTNDQLYTACGNKTTELQHSISTLAAQNSAIINAAAAEKAKNLQTISDLTGRISDLSQEVDDMTAQAKLKSLYIAPCPAVLTEKEGKYVMLGQFTLKN